MPNSEKKTASGLKVKRVKKKNSQNVHANSGGLVKMHRRILLLLLSPEL